MFAAVQFGTFLSFYGYATRSLTLSEGHRFRVFNRCWGEYFDLRGRKWRETGEDCI